MLPIDPLLRHYPPDCRSSAVEPLGFAGGMSGAQFWRITAPRGTLALRRWPPEHPNPERLRFIHAVLRHAANRGLAFLPVPIETLDGRSFVEHAGHLWELTPWLPGTADYHRSPSAERLRAALTALARFHVVTHDFSTAGDLPVAGRPPATARHVARLQQLTHGGIYELHSAITPTTWPALAPLAREFLAALPTVLPRAIARLEPLAHAPLPLQVCIRDIWHDHILFTGNEVTGIIDFGAVDIDTPATDIARLLGSLVADDAAGWQTGLEAYSATRPLSESELRAAQALDTSGTILAGCNWIRWIYIDGRDFANHAQVVERFQNITARAACAAQNAHFARKMQ